jgi:hypothetical protein
MPSREPKSSIDILEHVTVGGVHVYGKGSARSDAVSQSFHESALGGVMTADIVWGSHPLDAPPPAVEPPRALRRRR